jgi:hypothetical protein
MSELEVREKALKSEIVARFPEGTLLDVVFVWQIAGNPESEAANPNALDVRLLPEGPKEYNAFAADLPGRGKIPAEVYGPVVEEFWKKHKPTLEQIGRDLRGRLPERVRLGVSYGGYVNGWVTVDPPLTPVMARLDPTDLETLDALIAAGCAPNRADAIRWALARVRERPAYQKLVDRVREVQALRAEL